MRTYPLPPSCHHTLVRVQNGRCLLSTRDRRTSREMSLPAISLEWATRCDSTSRAGASPFFPMILTVLRTEPQSRATAQRTHPTSWRVEPSRRFRIDKRLPSSPFGSIVYNLAGVVSARHFLMHFLSGSALRRLWYREKEFWENESSTSTARLSFA